MIPRLLLMLAVFVPSPSSTSVPSCAIPNREAQVVDAVQPNYPDTVADLNLKTTVADVAVSLDADGKVLFSEISVSSGDDVLDEAALSAATRSTYLPRIVNCKAVPSLIGMREVFDNSSGTADPARTPDIAAAPKPSFSPPPGWSAAAIHDPQGWQMFYRWTKGISRIEVIGTVDMSTLEEMRAARERQMRVLHATILESKAVRICDGSQDGWLLVYTLRDAIGAQILSIRGFAEYWASYASLGNRPPSGEVIASLTSLCMPR